jgi:hypothetical protein
MVEKAVKFDPVIVARRLWDYTRLKGAPGHRRLATPLADATAPAAGDTEDGTVDRNVDGAKSNPKEPSAGDAALGRIESSAPEPQEQGIRAFDSRESPISDFARKSTQTPRNPAKSSPTIREDIPADHRFLRFFTVDQGSGCCAR